MPPARSNRLAEASSPYLLQHAHNPVDWWPWCEEAFEEARRRDVPVFLSIGYSTCYWCHVMERESFEDEQTAALLNKSFVTVKVDREEHPAVDDLYMAATQVSTGGGGWPMSVFLDPATRRPFYCGTYFPPEPRYGIPSFRELLSRLSGAWNDERAKIDESSSQLAEAVAQELAAESEPVAVGEPQVSQAASVLLRIHDAEDGGFGRAPKFPQPSYIEFLLDAREAADEPTRAAIDAAVRKTLDAMMLGGLHDQVGGGFHRYSVDATWTVPHFEKMLYDNAGLIQAYARAASVYEDDEYRRTAERAIRYVEREMTHGSGLFFSAQDAEVDGKEGLNYLWVEDELAAALSSDDASFAAELFGVAEGPNFQDPHHPEEPRRSVLRLSADLGASAGEAGVEPAEFVARLDRVCDELLAARGTRKQPRLDDKVITAWNGMMIEALARAAVSLGRPDLLDRAERSAGALWSAVVRADGTVRRTVRPSSGATDGPDGALEDYAFFARALTQTARASLAFGREPAEHARRATALIDAALERFGDPDRGGFFDSDAERTDLFVRPASYYDGAMESGTAGLTHALIDLWTLTEEGFYRDRATTALVASSSAIQRQPVSTVSSTRALLRAMKLGLPLAERWVALGIEAAPAEPEPAGRTPSPVRVFASEERVAVTSDEPAELSIFIEVESPYHVVAARPTDEGDLGLIPFRVGVAGGTGIAVYADYPDGEAYSVAGVEQPFRVYAGGTEIKLAVERVGEVTGRPVIVLGFQACTDRECLAPRNLELDVALDTD
ncbi:MAG: thioredoxin domain-containing protein [Planctomycetota bacterium]